MQKLDPKLEGYTYRENAEGVLTLLPEKVLVRCTGPEEKYAVLATYKLDTISPAGEDYEGV